MDVVKTKERKLYDLMTGKLNYGQRLFTITSSELVEKCLDMQQYKVGGGFITKQKRTTITTQCNHFMEFIGRDRKMDNIRREKYRDYYLFRRRLKIDIKVLTLTSESEPIL